MRRLATAVWSGWWLLVMLVAPPWLLVALFGWPLPRHPPDQSSLREWIVAAAVVFGWLLWLALVVAFCFRVGWAVRRARLPRLHLANPPEGLLTGLVGAVVVAATTAASRGTATPAPPVPAVATTPQLPAPISAADIDPGCGAPTADPVQRGDLPTATDLNTPPATVLSDHDNMIGGGARSSPAFADWNSGSGRWAGAATGAGGGYTYGDGLGGDGRSGDGGGGAGFVGDRLSGWGEVRRVGVELPGGGWVTRDTATAVVSAATVVWLRRRRRYLPRPVTGAARRDPDLTALSDTVLAVQHGLTHQQDDDPGRPSTDATRDTDPVGGGVGVGVDPAEVTDATLGDATGGPLRPGDLPAGGVGLTGAGAGDAVRGILTAVLLSGGPWHPDRDGQVLTTTADLAALVGPGVLRDGDPPGLSVFPDLTQALAVAEGEVVHRAQQLEDPDLPGVAAADGGPFPPLVLLTACPSDPAVGRRVAVLTLTPRRLGIAAVLLGAWTYGPTWLVDPDGTTRPDPLPGQRVVPVGFGPRLCVLSATAATDLLTLQAQARPRRHHLHHQDRPDAALSPLADPGHEGALDTPSPAPEIAAAAPPGTGPATTAPLAVRVLGPVSIGRVGDPAVSVGLRRSAAVQALVFLAVHRDGATSSQLAAALWPGVRPYPTGRVYTALSSLRTAIAATTRVPDIVTRIGDAYRLDDTRVQVDLWQLHTAVQHAATSPDTDLRAAALQAVVDTWTGELAAGQDWPWLAPHREATRRHVLDAYTTLAAAADDPPTAATLLRDALAVDPFNEDLHRQAMRAHAAAGQPTRIAPLLAGLTARLAEFDDDPEPGTERLAGQLAGGLSAHGGIQHPTT